MLFPEEEVRLSPPKSFSFESPEAFVPLAPSQYRAPAMALYGLNQGRTYYEARTILTADDRVLLPFSAWMGNGPKDNWMFGKLKLKAMRKLPGSGFLLGGYSNYYHFLVLNLMGLALLEGLGKCWTDFDFLLVERPRHPFQKWFHQRLGISPERAVYLDDYPHVACDELFFPSNMWLPGPSWMKCLGAWLTRYLTESYPEEPPLRLYVSRSKCLYGRVSNEREVIEKMKEHGFQVVNAEDLEVPAQFSLFRRAGVVVGAHGAGLSNLQLCRPGCRVLEILNRAYRRETYWRLSSLVGLEYYRFFADPDTSPFVAPTGIGPDPPRLPNITVDLGLFQMALEGLLNE